MRASRQPRRYRSPATSTRSEATASAPAARSSVSEYQPVVTAMQRTPSACAHATSSGVSPTTTASARGHVAGALARDAGQAGAQLVVGREAARDAVEPSAEAGPPQLEPRDRLEVAGDEREAVPGGLERAQPVVDAGQHRVGQRSLAQLLVRARGSGAQLVHALVDLRRVDRLARQHVAHDPAVGAAGDVRRRRARRRAEHLADRALQRSLVRVRRAPHEGPVDVEQYEHPTSVDLRRRPAAASARPRVQLPDSRVSPPRADADRRYHRATCPPVSAPLAARIAAADSGRRRRLPALDHLATDRIDRQRERWPARRRLASPQLGTARRPGGGRRRPRQVRRAIGIHERVRRRIPRYVATAGKRRTADAGPPAPSRRGCAHRRDHPARRHSPMTGPAAVSSPSTVAAALMGAALPTAAGAAGASDPGRARRRRGPTVINSTSAPCRSRNAGESAAVVLPRSGRLRADLGLARSWPRASRRDGHVNAARRPEASTSAVRMAPLRRAGAQLAARYRSTRPAGPEHRRRHRDGGPRDS